MTFFHNDPAIKRLQITFFRLAWPFSFFVIFIYCDRLTIFAQTPTDQISPNAYPLNCPMLPHNGAGVLEAAIRDDGAAVLRGIVGKKIIWEKSFPLPEQLNTAKAFADCEGSKITLYSQFPFSARTRIYAFAWDGSTLRLVSDKITDASADAVEEIIRAAEIGDEVKLEDLKGGGDRTPQIFYPGNYITTETIAQSLKRGHAAALKLSKEKKPLEAANRLALMFETTVFFSGLIGDVENISETAPERWLQVWKARGLVVKDYVGILNDYGFFLQQSGDHSVAAAIFKTILQLSPGRTAAYLNLGDSLWELNLFDDAKKAYQKYQEVLIVRRQFKAIPARVVQRLGKV